MAIQIECMRRILAVRSGRSLRGRPVERQVDGAVHRARIATVIRHFLGRRLGPLSIPPLPIRRPEPTGSTALVVPTGLASRLTASTSLPTILEWGGSLRVPRTTRSSDREAVETLVFTRC
jgi:hypothetical protein